MASSRENPIAVIVDRSSDAAEYLETLETRAGLRWLLTHNIHVFRTLLERAGDEVQLVVLDFSTALTEKLQFYMEGVRRDPHNELPFVLLCTEQTEERARKVADRPIDRLLQRPFTAEQLELVMGKLMGRSERRAKELKFWIFLEERIIEGRTTDVSNTGMGGHIPDPILFKHVHIRLFSADDEATVDVAGLVRRKQRLAEGGYQLGVQFERLIEGDLEAFQRAAGIDLRGLATAGEETLSGLSSRTSAATPPAAKPGSKPAKSNSTATEEALSASERLRELSQRVRKRSEDLAARKGDAGRPPAARPGGGDDGGGGA